MNTTLKVAVLLADGLPREQISTRLGLTRYELEGAVARLERVSLQIERDDESMPSADRGAVST
jgi:hypothetical protein